MQSGLMVFKIKLSGGGASNNSSKEKTKQSSKHSLKNKYSNKGEAVGLEFLKRLLELHGSGMPVADAVKLLNHRLSDPQRRIYQKSRKELAEGRTLSRARQLPGYFSESSTYVIEVYMTGNLAPILSKIISHLEESGNPFEGGKGMTYPLFVGLMAIGVVLFFLFFLLPQIQEMLASLGRMKFDTDND